jgi:hypothetical protein
MLLLALIAVAQLAVLVMIVALVAGEASRQETEQLAGGRIRGIQRQTIDAMFAASDGDVIDQASHRVYPEQ